MKLLNQCSKIIQVLANYFLDLVYEWSKGSLETADGRMTSRKDLKKTFIYLHLLSNILNNP